MDFPGGSDGKVFPPMWEIQVQPLGWEDPLEKGMVTHSSILAGEFYGRRSLAGYGLQGCKELDMSEKLTQH